MQGKTVIKQIWGLLSPLVLRYAVTYIIALFFIEQFYEYPTEMGAVAAVVTIPFLVMMVKKDGIFPKRKASFTKYGMIVGASAAVAIGLNNLLLLADLAKYSESYQDAAETLYAPTFVVQLICVGIIYPIMEEYMFRGVIYRRMRSLLSVRKAIVVSSIFFGLYHGNLVQMIYGAAAGLMLAFIYEKYGSMCAPILAHIVMNIVACVLTEVDGFSWMFAHPIRLAAITTICIVLAYIMLVLIKKIDEKSE